MKKTYFIVLIFLLTGGRVISQVCYDYSAVNCNPSNKSIEEKSFKQTHGKIYHAETSIKTITFFGPIQHPGNSGYPNTVLNLLYRDPDGNGIKSKIMIALKRVHKSTGQVEELESFNSNNSDYGLPGDIKKGSVQILEKVDLAKYYYYVQITMQRSTNTLTPEVFGYSLCHTL